MEGKLDIKDNTVPMRIDTMAGGVVYESLGRCLDEVIENIRDTGTCDGKRSIVLKIDFKADEDREKVGISVSCQSKLQPQAIKVVAKIEEGMDGQARMFEHFVPWAGDGGVA